MQSSRNQSILQQEQVIAALHRRAVEIIARQDEANRDYCDEVDIAATLLSAEAYQSDVESN